jgi:hypothetical protein
MQNSLQEKTMKNRKSWIVMSAIVLVFGMMVVGCGDPDADPALNGTWVMDDYDVEIKFDDGNFWVSSYGKDLFRGTYITSGSTLTMITTHVHANCLDEGSGWYTRAQFIQMYDVTDEDLAREVDITTSYSISGNTLTLTTIWDGEETFTKK